MDNNSSSFIKQSNGSDDSYNDSVQTLLDPLTRHVLTNLIHIFYPVFFSKGINHAKFGNSPLASVAKYSKQEIRSDFLSCCSAISSFHSSTITHGDN